MRTLFIGEDSGILEEETGGVPLLSSGLRMIAMGERETGISRAAGGSRNTGFLFKNTLARE